MIDYCSIGKRIKLTRIKQGVLQKDLAEKIGISKPHMSNIETAHTKIGLETLVAIANALNTSVDEFLSDTVSNSQVIFNDELKTVLERADMEELKVICKLARVILKRIKAVAIIKQTASCSSQSALFYLFGFDFKNSRIDDRQYDQGQQCSSGQPTGNGYGHRIPEGAGKHRYQSQDRCKCSQHNRAETYDS